MIDLSNLKWVSSGAMAAMLLLGVLPAGAQSCPDGRLASGACANAGVSSFMRRSGVAFTQLKLSYTGLPLRADLNGPGNLNNQRGRDATYENSGYGGQPAPSTQSAGTFVYLPPGVNPNSLQIQRPYVVVPGGIILR